jgi:adenylate cyclase
MKSPYVVIQSDTKKAVKVIVSSTLTMTLVGIVYALIFVRPHPHTVLNGILIGGTIGLVGSMAEVFFFTRYRQRLPFTVLLTLRSLFYVALISFTTIYVIAVHTAWMYNLSLPETFRTPEYERFMYEGEFVRILIFSLAASFMTNFIRQVNKLLGHNALLLFMTGKYHQPVEEERIFMFLDLNRSTTIAEHLGNIRYHHFLNDFFHDISPAIVESKGHICQYVGDEVVVTWTKEKGLENANCINCYFRIAAAIHIQSEKYEKRYGFIPEFKAGYHYGPVISGEIGDVKREIVYHGDTVNTAARIRSACTRFECNLLLSGDLLKNLPQTDYISPQPIGKIQLRGKTEEVELFRILEAA